MSNIGVRSARYKLSLWVYPGVSIVHAGVISDKVATPLTSLQLLRPDYLTEAGMRIVQKILEKCSEYISSITPHQEDIAIDLKPIFALYAEEIWLEVLRGIVAIVRRETHAYGPVVHVPAGDPSEEANWVKQLVPLLNQ